MKRFIFISILFALMVYTVISCKPKASNNVTPADGNFPAEIANIFISKCATTGCHNAASSAAGLTLDSWEHLFQGDGQGAVVVPYCTQYSLLLYRVNTDSSLGTIVLPIQPPTISTSNPATPLSKSEYMTLYNWIASGAPDKYGNIPFASDPDTRQKIYLTEQGCDLVSVIDAKSMVIMRYIQVGIYPGLTEAPHCIAMSDDGMSAYVGFYAGPGIQKIDTRSDTVVGTVNMSNSGVPGGGSWGIAIASPDNSGVALTNFQSTGGLELLNTSPTSFKHKSYYSNGLGFAYLHGIESNPTWDTFYMTGQYGNVIYKFFPAVLQIGNNPVKQISVDANPPLATDSNNSKPNPHEIQMVPDDSRYFVTCQGTNDVRVMDAYADTLIKVIPVGSYPQEMAMSGNPATPYIFVCCMGDASNPGAGEGNIGSVYVLDYNTYQVVSIIYGDFALPHDLAVDDQDGLLYVVSTNSDPNGPKPHHVTACGGRAGWYSVYKFGPNYFVPANKNRYQTTVFPYSIDPRF